LFVVNLYVKTVEIRAAEPSWKWHCFGALLFINMAPDRELLVFTNVAPAPELLLQNMALAPASVYFYTLTFANVLVCLKMDG